MMKEQTAYDNLPAKQLCRRHLRNTRDLLWDPITRRTQCNIEPQANMPKRKSWTKRPWLDSAHLESQSNRPHRRTTNADRL
jgi:hypothetical protein